MFQILQGTRTLTACSCVLTATAHVCNNFKPGPQYDVSANDASRPTG